MTEVPGGSKGVGFTNWLVNKAAGTCLNVTGGSSEPGTNTHQYYCDPDNDANLWQWVGTGEWRQLVNVEAETCLNVTEGSSEPDTNTHQYYCDPDNDANLWVVAWVAPSP